MSSIAKRIAASNPPPIVSSFTKRKNLYEVLNLLENNGIQQRVVPDKWLKKGIQDSYYVVDRVKLKQDLKHGKAWGVKYWKGKQLNDGKTEEIRGGLKWNWQVAS